MCERVAAPAECRPIDAVAAFGRASESTGIRLRRGAGGTRENSQAGTSYFLTREVRSAILHLSDGGIAQLGERLDGIEKVRGSSPLTSIQQAEEFACNGLQGLEL